ncbi:MAG: REP-associated tyrosine transposase [Desulfobaccales bacterium]
MPRIPSKYNLGGTGFQPVQSFQITRRDLPHWQEPGRVYFITWRCNDGVVLSTEERQITMEALRYWESKKWILYAAVVLPDHVHVLGQPLWLDDGGAFNLGEILHSIKRFSARKINQGRGVQGSLWQDERFDRIVRDEAEFLEKWQYIRNNPLKAGLVLYPEDYPWLYERTE